MTSSDNGRHVVVAQETRSPASLRQKRGCLFRSAQIFLILNIVLGGYALWWASRTPNIRRNFAAEMNAPTLAADPATLAWPEIRAALLARPLEPEKLREVNPATGRYWTDARPSDPEWPDVAAYARTLEPTLDRIRTAAKRPKLGYLFSDAEDADFVKDAERRSGETATRPPLEATPNPALVDITLEHLGKFRLSARALRISTRLAMDESNPELVLDNIETLFNLSRLCTENATIIATLVSVAIDALTLDLIAEVLETNTSLFTPEQLARLDLLVRESSGKQNFEAAFTNERAMFEDCLQRHFSDDGNGNGTMTLSGSRLLGGPGGELMQEHESPLARALQVVGAATLVADRKSQIDLYDRILAAHKQDASVPAWEYLGTSRATQELEDPDALLGRLRHMPVYIFLPAIGKVHSVRMQLDHHVQATEAIIALHRYRTEKSEWPKSLDALVPEYIARLPLDRFDGQPLRYLIKDGRPLLYSIATNRKDDGGASAPHKTFAGEWVSPSRLKSDPRFAPGRPVWDHIFYPLSKANLPEESSPAQ